MADYKKIWYVSLHRLGKNEKGYTVPIPYSTIYVQYVKTKKQAQEIASKVNNESFIAFVDWQADTDIQRLGVENMFSANPQRTPVKLVDDILSVV